MNNKLKIASGDSKWLNTFFKEPKETPRNLKMDQKKLLRMYCIKTKRCRILIRG